MGLGGMKYAWQRQTKDFGHTKGHQYSCLVTDNRGIGDSDKPTSRYSTSEMAKDLIEVIDHVGWTTKRDLHIIGISMGGMIAQEIVSRVFLILILHRQAFNDRLQRSDTGYATFRQPTHIHPSCRRQAPQKNDIILSDTMPRPVISAVHTLSAPLVHGSSRTHSPGNACITVIPLRVGRQDLIEEKIFLDKQRGCEMA